MRHQSSGRRRLGLSLAATTVCMWGILPLGLNVVLGVMDVWTISWYRFGMSAVVLAIWLGLRGELPRLNRLSRRGGLLLALSTLGLCGNYVAYLKGLDMTSPATAQVLIQLAPPLLSLGGLMLFHERYSAWQWRGFATTLVGLGLFHWLRLQRTDVDVSELNLGAVVIVFAALAWAIYGLAQKQLLGKLTSQQIMLCIYVGSALLLTPFSRPADIGLLNGFELCMLIFCGLNTVIAYGAFAEALEHEDAARVGAVLTVTPLATVAAVYLASSTWPNHIAADPVSLAAFGAASMAVAGSATTALAGAKRRPIVVPDEEVPKRAT